MDLAFSQIYATRGTIGAFFSSRRREISTPRIKEQQTDRRRCTEARRVKAAGLFIFRPGHLRIRE